MDRQTELCNIIESQNIYSNMEIYYVINAADELYNKLCFKTEGTLTKT